MFKVISKFSKKQSNHNEIEGAQIRVKVQSYLKIFKEAIKSQLRPLGKLQPVCSKLSQNFQRSNHTTNAYAAWQLYRFKVISKFSKKQSNHNSSSGEPSIAFVQSYLKIFKEAIKSQPKTWSPYPPPCSKLSQNFQRSNQITTRFAALPNHRQFKVISKFSKKQSNHNDTWRDTERGEVQSYLKIFKEAIKSQLLYKGLNTLVSSKLSQNFQRSNQITTLSRRTRHERSSKLSQNFQRSNQITTGNEFRLNVLQFKVI